MHFMPTARRAAAVLLCGLGRTAAVLLTSCFVNYSWAAKA